MCRQRLLAIVCSVYAIYIMYAATKQINIIHVLPDNQQYSAFNQCYGSIAECYHLSELINDSFLLNTLSNTAINFYPGVHLIFRSANAIFSINNAANIKLTAASPSEGATVKCEGKIGLVFSFCTNLSITGISFEGCAAYLVPQHPNYKECIEHPFSRLPAYTKKVFALCISNTLNVHMSGVAVTNGSGVGLLVVNIHSQFELTYSRFNNAPKNLYIFSYDVKNNDTTATDTIITIKHSKFMNNIIKNDNSLSSGVHMKLLQTQISMKVEIKNVTLEQGNKYNIVINLNNDRNEVLITNLTSISVSLMFGMWINPIITKSGCNTSKMIPNIALNNAHFKQGGLIVTYTYKGKLDYKHDECGGYITLSHIIINGIRTKFIALLFNKVNTAVVQNMTIQHSAGRVLTMNSNILIRSHFVFIQNNSTLQFFKESKMIVESNTTLFIRENFGTVYSPIFFAGGSGIELHDNTSIRVEGNTGQSCGGLILFNSTITFKGKSRVVLMHNNGIRGGAIAFYQKSKFKFDSGDIEIILSENYANIKGGAMFVQDADYAEYVIEIFERDSRTKITKSSKLYKSLFESNGGSFNFYFNNNSAGQAGNEVYGGIIIGSKFHFSHPVQNDVSIISSDPFEVCICINSEPNCTIRNVSVEIFPGQSYQLEVTARGQGGGIVPSTIQAAFDGHSHSKLQRVEYIQAVDKKCSVLTYTVEFSSETELLKLTTAEQTWITKIPFIINFHRKICKAGFTLNVDKSKCICDELLIDHGIECNIQTLQINRLSQKWVGVTYKHLSPNQQQPGVIVHDYCPFDYCIATTQSLDLSIPNQQCAFNRSGILCGECEANYSHAFGTSKCKLCTKPWIALIIPLIAVAGVTLVVGLIFLNLTVSIGTINGLIFYINIVGANHSIFFPHSVSTSFLSKFIAWLNLDLGIEICFYSGLDAYSKTWFQFLFPLYIWFILISIIIVSHYSTQVSKLVGNNAVQVLATLFLLSYAKLLRIIITVFSSTELVYPDGYHRRVWLYDGNVDYFKGKHIPMFVAALVLLIFISLPFTMILFCTQCMQKLSNKRVLSWVGKLQPLFDAYTGPYKIKHRYWTGLLLLIRVGLFLIFSLNTIGNPMINLLAICITMSCLLAYLSLIGGVYKSWWLNVIETAFILNLLILSSATFYQNNTGTSIKPITYTSTGIALVLFIGILIYHVILKVTTTKLGQITKKVLAGYHHLLTKSKLSAQNEPKSGQTRFNSKDLVTYTEVQLDEPLLNSD